ncbi:ABC transporter ATP-binding protein [Pelistega sp. MC2]|uniref:ATP-binding cassette domain-containing protein n=1 Tax=Pelistega sp. MC2 TaxID=1720297 RepID=UPI0008D90192|nr:ABC transporter ATP-binding protein [Pelistega sp. MC2]
MTHKNKNLVALIPTSIHGLLAKISLGWILVALVESMFYITLCLFIMYKKAPSEILMLALLYIIFTTVVVRNGYLTGVKVAGILYQGLEHTLSTAKLSWFCLETQAKVNSMTSQKIPFLMSLPAHQLQTFIHALFLPIFITLGIAIFWGTEIATLVTIALISAFGMQLLGQKFLKKAAKSQETLDNEIAQQIITFIENIEVQRSYVGMSASTRQLEQVWRDNEKVLGKLNFGSAIATFFAYTSSLLPVIITSAYLLVIDNSQINILILAILVTRASSPFEALANAILTLTSIRGAFIQYDELTHAPTLKNEAEYDLPNSIFPLSAHNISHNRVLNNVSFDIWKNQRIQIKGKSGSGKTTLLELLMRFDDPEQGIIKLGEKSVTKYHYDEFIKLISYVPQNPMIFTGSLADNIRLSQRSITDSQIIEVLTKLGLSSIIKRNAAGINQCVGQNGSMLSGGEKQRLCIARAILKSTPILVLDEATSALDEATEKMVISYIKTLPTTVIFTTHRNEHLWERDAVITL